MTKTKNKYRKMKITNSPKKWAALIYATALSVIALSAFRAEAQLNNGQQSFNPTNMIIGTNQNVVSDPTNANGVLTGTGIRMDNYKEAAFYMSGYNSNATAAALTAVLERAGTGNTPRITTTNRDWEVTSPVKIIWTTPAAVGPWYFYTNLDAYNIGSAGWIGLNSVTNATASTAITNFDAGMVKKIVPLRFP